MSEKFEVGQKVIVESRNNKKVDVVDKITPTGLISVGGLLYRSDGTQRTSDVGKLSLEKLQELIDVLS